MGLWKTIYVWSIHAPARSGSRSWFNLDNLPFDQFYPEAGTTTPLPMKKATQLELPPPNCGC